MRNDLTPEQNVRFMVDELGMREEEARFIVAIETGEIDGDIIVVDDEGREVRQRARLDDQRATGSVGLDSIRA